MPTLYEPASNPIHYAGTGTALLLSDGRILNWRLVVSAGRSLVRGDYFDANGVATGQSFQTTKVGFEHDIVALNNGGVAIVYHNDQLSANSTHEVYLTIYNALGVLVVENVQVNILAQNNQYNPEVAVLASGQVVITWTSESPMGGDPDRGVMARIFNPNGTPAGGEFLVNTTISGLQQDSIVLALPDGGFAISWNAGLQIFDANGAKVGPERPGGHTDLQLLQNGNIVALFRNFDTGSFIQILDPTGAAVLASVSVPNGTRILGTFANGFVVNLTTGTAIFDNMAVQQGSLFPLSATLVTPGAGGGFDYYSNSEIGHVRLDDGIGIAEVVPVTGALSETTPQNNFITSLTTDGEALNTTYTYELVSDSLGGAFQLVGNRLYLVDASNLDFETAATVSVTVAATDLNGNRYVDSFTLNVQDEVLEQRVTGNPALAPFGFDFSALAFDRFVSFSTQYPAGSAIPVSGQLFDSDLNLYRSFTVVESADLGIHGGFAVLPLPSGRFVVTWSASLGDGTDAGILTRVFDAEGNALSDVILVGTPTPLATGYPVITALGSGGDFVIAWEEQGGDAHSYGVIAQRFSASGAKIGAEFVVNGEQVFDQRHPVLQALPGGGFLAFWTDTSQIGGDASSSAVKSQLFDAAGAKIGGEFLVNTATAGAQQGIAATALASGNILVTWGSTPGPSGSTSIIGQMFSSAGAKIGGEIVLKSPSPSSGGGLSVALPSGGFALAWTDGAVAPDTTVGSVWAQFFDGNGAPTTAKFLVNTETDGTQFLTNLTLLANGHLYIEWGSVPGHTQARIFDPTGAQTDWPVDDRLAGTTGADMLRGGSGNDIYVVNHPGDVAIELPGQGIDIIYSSISYSLTDAYEVESLATFDWDSTEPLNLTGNSLANTLIGNAGANQLNGAAGADIMFGREGNDIYIVDNVGDQPTEYVGEGIDTVYSSISYTLAAGTDVEGLATLDWGATTALNLTGNGLANTLIGNAGGNQLDGAVGADVMVGREGNDIYLVDHAGDKAFESAGQGYDVIYTGVSFALTNDQSLEGLSTINWLATDAINLTGNSADNYLIGNAGANVLNGGAGNDVLHGKEGADTYQFTALLGPTNVDLILEYSAADDTIALDNNGIFTGLADGALPASAFVIGSAAQDADDRIVYNSATGQLFFDIDGNGAGAQVQFALLSGAPVITASDFTVI